MRILVTGAGGFLGREVVRRLLERGEQVYALVRDPKRCPDGAECLLGDVTKPFMGVEATVPADEVWHLAGYVDLGDRHPKMLQSVNVDGTFNALNYAHRAGASRFVFVSTAYVHGRSRNPYEASKKCAERYCRDMAGLNGHALTIFRPSIIVASTETRQPPRGKGFYRFVLMVARIYGRIERTRRVIQDAARLPPIQAVFRVRGDARVRLNLVPVDLVARAMVGIRRPGVYHLTNPLPPTLRDLSRWVGEALLLNTCVLRRFPMSAPEALFDRLMEPFLRYMQEPIWLPPSDIQARTPPVNRRFIVETVRKAVG